MDKIQIVDEVLRQWGYVETGLPADYSAKIEHGRVNKVWPMIAEEYRPVLEYHYKKPGFARDKSAALGITRDKWHETLRHAQIQMYQLLKTV